MPTNAYVGIDVAVADGKRLQVCACCWRDGQLIPLTPKKPGQDAGASAWMQPPEMPGNGRMVDAAVRAELASEAGRVPPCGRGGWGARTARIGIDALREPRPAGMDLRACEAALGERGISFIQTPDQPVVPENVAAYQRDRPARRGLPPGQPHLDAIWA